MPDGVALFMVYGMLPFALLAYIVFGLIPPWWAAQSAGLPVGMVQVLDMRVHAVNAWLVVQVLKRLQKLPLPEGVDPADSEHGVYTQDVSDAYLNGVDLRDMLVVMDAALAAGKSFDYWSYVEADCRRRGVPPPGAEPAAEPAVEPAVEPESSPESADSAESPPRRAESKKGSRKGKRR